MGSMYFCFFVLLGLWTWASQCCKSLMQGCGHAAQANRFCAAQRLPCEWEKRAETHLVPWLFLSFSSLSLFCYRGFPWGLARSKKPSTCIYLRRTVASATSRESLLFIGALCDDEEATDKLKLHSSLLLAILGALCDLDSNHRALPWRVSVAIDHTQLPSLLKFMEQEWFFVNAVIDTLDDKEPLWRLLSHTRWQVYRDCMTKGEQLWGQFIFFFNC